MSVISITMIIELNKSLQEKGIPFKVHLSDACGKQSMWFESLNEMTTEPPETFYQAVEEYFEKKHVRLEYSPDKHILWAAR